MKDILITSSVLILALAALRLLFRNAISRRAQYALWALVLVRLLVPVSLLPETELSVLSAAQPVQSTISQQLEQRKVYVLPVNRAPISDYPAAYDMEPGEVVPTGQSSGYPVLNHNGITVTTYARQITMAELLTLVWTAGAVLFGLLFLGQNLSFWHRLRKVRVLYSVDGCSLPVYLVEEGLSSPCLFGLLRPAVYLTPASAGTPESLRHVLAHETTHFRHGDHIWGLLRCVCLAAYWFNPLVWLAAALSRADCELACDESALKRLSPGERTAYGHTLLSLIPVRQNMRGVCLTATTMAAGKRQLRDRIRRIAENRRPLAAALAAVVLLAAALCATVFAGGVSPQKPKEEGSRPLTAEEMKIFQDMFDGEGFHFRSQFLTSSYLTPQDIDLCQLFYNGSDTPESPADSERADAAAALGFDPEVDFFKISAANMDAALLQYTGFKLAQTNKVGLDSFIYLSKYNAYYLFHGDTNAFTPVFTMGTRDGNQVTLQYFNDLLGGEMKLTLTANDNGGWYVFSNLPVPSGTVLPEGRPEQVIPLSGLEPYQAPALEQVRLPQVQDILLSQNGIPSAEQFYKYLAICRAADGGVWACVDDLRRNSYPQTGWALPIDDTRQSYLDAEIEDGNLSIRLFSLFGKTGWELTYPGWVTDHYYGQIHDYITLDEAGAPSLLLRSYGNQSAADVDGDGMYELSASTGEESAALFFQRDGQIYRADLLALLEDGGKSYPRYGTFQPQTDGSVRASFSYSLVEPLYFYAQRYLYCDGNSLLVYPDLRAYHDHVIEGLDVPDGILADARKDVRERLAQAQANEPDAGYDDWRISGLQFSYYYEDFHGLNLYAYTLDYQLHAAKPEKVVLAGARYLMEGGWMNDASQALIFQALPEGGVKLLYSIRISDCEPGSEMFASDLEHLLFADDLIQPTGIRPPDYTEADAQAAEEAVRQRLTQFAEHPNVEKLEIEDIHFNPSGTAYAAGLFGPEPVTGNGPTNRMLAVLAVYDLRYTAAARDAFSPQEGVVFETYFLLPDEAAGGWYIWDSIPTDARAAQNQ